MVVFLAINTVITPPAVSIPKDKGVTSNNNTSLRDSEPVLVKMAAYTAASKATASSGLILLLGSFPLKKSVII